MANRAIYTNYQPIFTRKQAFTLKIILTRVPAERTLPQVQKGNASAFDSSQVRFLLRMPLPRTITHYAGRKLFRFLLTIQGLGAFALITLGVILTKFRAARRLIWPLVFHETSRAGLRLLPMFLFLSAALGLLIIGQTVSWLTRAGAIKYLGTIMVI